MKKRMNVMALAIASIMLLLSGCKQKETVFYSVSDFRKVPKIDVHFHYNTTDIRYVKYADSLNFRLLSPNVDAGQSIDDQLQKTSSIRKLLPNQFAFFGTFSVQNFRNNDFAEKTIARIDECMKDGASGIKIWKNIGMAIKDGTGHFVMVDNSVFEPVFNYFEKKNIPLMAHLGEPKDCWLSEDQMDLGNNRRYFHEHPQYHMFKHPEAPSYQDQINAMINLLNKHPKLDYLAAHLASLEWNVDELARLFVRFPNVKADFAARIGHLQFQSLANREKVRDFMIKYQDRLLYGTDQSLDETSTNYRETTSEMRRTWTDQWIFLATDSSIMVSDLDQKNVRGLKLPREVIDKIYFKNAERFFR